MNERLKPAKTVLSSYIFKLPGGTKENDLPVEVRTTTTTPGITDTVLSSTWVPTDEQRALIADGANIELLVWGEGHPPVALELTDVELVK